MRKDKAEQRGVGSIGSIGAAHDSRRSRLFLLSLLSRSFSVVAALSILLALSGVLSLARCHYLTSQSSYQCRTVILAYSVNRRAPSCYCLFTAIGLILFQRAY